MTTLRALSFAAASLLALSLVLADPAAAQPPPVTDAQVDEQIAKLDADDIVERNDAQAQLEKWATGGQLTPVQIGKLKAATKAPNSNEVITAAKAILRKYAISLAVVRAVLDAVRVVILGPVDHGGPRIGFSFDAMTGFSIPNNPVLTRLEQLYAALRDAIFAGDTAPGPGGAPDPITAAAQALRNYINGLTPGQFADLDIEIDGVPATRAQVLDKIDQAINGIPAAKDALNLNTGGEAPGAHGRAHIPPGSNVHPDVGRTLSLAIAQVDVPGQLDISKVTRPDNLSAGPPGYRVDGESYDLLADSALAVAGSITLALRYGSTLPDGNQIFDRDALQLARMANGQIILLPSVNDPINGIISATYVPDPFPSGFAQFGEFALVEPNPVPSATGWGVALVSLILIASGLAALRLRRQSA